MKRNQKSLPIILPLLLISLFACGYGNQNPPKEVPTNQIQAFPSPTPTYADNFLSDTGTIDAARLQLNCSDTMFIDHVPDNFPWLFAIQTGLGFDVRLWDMNNNEKTNLFSGDSISSNLKTSPDGKMLAFEEITTVNDISQSKVVVLDAQKNTVLEIPQNEDGFFHVLYWADNNHLWLIKSTEQNNNDYIFLIEPISGIIQEYPIRFPNQYAPSLYPHYLHFYSTLNSVYYSPTIENFVYSSSNGLNYLLCNTQNENECLQIPSDYSFVYPDWSPDGNSFIVAQKFSEAGNNDIRYQELFQIDTMGNIKRLTYLSNYYPEGVNIDNYRWSPNGNMIGFRFYDEADPDSHKQFGLYNFETGIVTQYCFNSETELLNPVWSPDSKYIILNESYSGQNNNVFLINLTNMKISHVGDGFFVVGFVEDSKN